MILIINKSGNFADNLFIVGPNKFDSSSIKSLRAFGGVAHDKNWLAKSGSLFLDSA